MYYGQYGQDSVLDAFFSEDDNGPGFYVDVGASDGIRFSNSYFLASERGWSGICVEAHPDYYKLLETNRPKSKNYNCAVGNQDGETIPIRLNYRASLTSLDLSLDERFSVEYRGYYANRNEKEVNGFRNGVFNVPSRTIDSILEETFDLHSGNIDILCIDIDGSEKYAFEGLTLDEWKPRILVLEHTTMGHDFVDSFARASGYKKCKTIGSDNFYTHNDKDAGRINLLEPSRKLFDITHPADQR